MKFSTFSPICKTFDPLAKFSAFDSGVFREKNNSANAMIKKHLMRAFERGAWRDHRPNIGLKRGSSQVFHSREDSIYCLLAPKYYVVFANLANRPCISHFAFHEPRTTSHESRKSPHYPTHRGRARSRTHHVEGIG